MREVEKEALDYILDIMGGADGGIGFVNLRSMIEHLSTATENGDETAEEALRMSLHSFKRLIEVANRKQ